MDGRSWTGWGALWLPPLVYMAIIFYFSSLSNPVPQVTAHVWDKLLHTTEYAGLAALFCRAWRGQGFGWAAAACLAIACTSVYGASDEYHQAFVPLRSSDIHDWMADTLGAAMGVAAYALLVRFDVRRVDFD